MSVASSAASSSYNYSDDISYEHREPSYDPEALCKRLEENEPAITDMTLICTAGGVQVDLRSELFEPTGGVSKSESLAQAEMRRAIAQQSKQDIFFLFYLDWFCLFVGFWDRLGQAVKSSTSLLRFGVHINAINEEENDEEQEENDDEEESVQHFLI